MGRGQSGCCRCGGTARRLSVRDIIGDCFNCHGPVCSRHARWSDSDGVWVCSRCDRK